LTNRTGHHGTIVFYDPAQVTLAWNFLVNATIANPGLLDIPTFHNDMVDVTRQVFSNAFIGLYNSTIDAWNAGNVTGVHSLATTLIDFLTDLDTMLGTDPGFLLGTWIGDARACAGDNDTYADFLEYQARNQVSCPFCQFDRRLHCGDPRAKSTITHRNNGLVSSGHTTSLGKWYSYSTLTVGGESL
jgi:alpha-N-acetylglucosaminidase